ncbi:type I pullulanase [Evansella halocellulosilytica]|uniref:type I pullulanase n=1 Tax=Evansella halocellulosilytica TaxID=2011013 RepID=UPI000BB928B6|nr:type I pullulanase [Evansella halocellulosilytica]
MSVQVAWLDGVHEIIIDSDQLKGIRIGDKPIVRYGKKEFAAHFEGYTERDEAKFSVGNELPLGEELVLYIESKRFQIYPRKVIHTTWFEENYTAANTQLGTLYRKEATSFTIWAPIATSVKLFLDNNIFYMKKLSRGVWKADILGDWHGAVYEYELIVNGELVRVNDPYTKGMLANSEKGVVIDLERTNSPFINNQERPSLTRAQDAVIYELHVRDASIHENSGVTHKGKFLGLAEKETKTANGYSTGLSYIKELGVTHVQLLPINDFARVDENDPAQHYNWGYDPLFFQVPEGSYATDPNDPVARIRECKEMIAAFHELRLGVIIDVVFNHVFIREESPFEKIVPGYYFRYHADGTISNGTGVGNDLATEKVMVQKFIIDTIDYWLTEYKVDGFRFDLMGAIDLDTMQKIEHRCSMEESKILLLGEGWDLPTALHHSLKTTANQSNQIKGIAFFNDFFRDSLKGHLFNLEEKGFVNGSGRFSEKMPHLVTGSVLDMYGEPFVSHVSQSVNYVECHDNHTLWDRLQHSNSNDKEFERKRIHQLATGLTLLSQGIPFLHAGQEWFRSKKGDGNSYISGDHINMLDWGRRELEDKTIEFIRTLIKVRKTYNVFRLSSKEEIQHHIHMLETEGTVFGFTLFDACEDLAVYVNPTSTMHKLRLPSAGTWEILASNSEPTRKTHQFIGEFGFIDHYELLVIKKSRCSN